MTLSQVNRLPSTQEYTLQSVLSCLGGSYNKQIVWLQGAPKSGKSVIASSIASRLHRTHQLAASLNLRHAREALGSLLLELIVNRIAEQLSQLSSHFAIALGLEVD